MGSRKVIYLDFCYCKDKSDKLEVYTLLVKKNLIDNASYFWQSGKTTPTAHLLHLVLHRLKTN